MFEKITEQFQNPMFEKITEQFQKPMFEKITEQFQNSLNPVNELFANNAKVLVQLAEKQTQLFTDVVNESVAYTKTLSEQKDMPGVFDVQKAFFGNVQNKVVAANEETSKLLSEVQTAAGETVKPLFTQAMTAASAFKAAK